MRNIHNGYRAITYSPSLVDESVQILLIKRPLHNILVIPATAENPFVTFVAFNYSLF